MAAGCVRRAHVPYGCRAPGISAATIGASNAVTGDRVGRIWRPTPGDRPGGLSYNPMGALLLLEQFGKTEVPADFGQRIDIDIAHEIGHRKFARLAGKYRDSGNFALLGTHPDFNIFAIFALHAYDAVPLGRL